MLKEKWAKDKFFSFEYFDYKYLPLPNSSSQNQKQILLENF